MKRFFLAVVVVLCLSELAPAKAQFVAGPVRFRSSSSFTFRSGFGFPGSHFRVGGFRGVFVTRSAFFAPPVFASPFFFPPPVFLPPPPFGFGVGFGNPFFGGWGPGFGWGSGFGAFGPYGFGPQFVPVPVPVPVGGGNFPDPDAPPLAGNIPPRNDAVLFPKGDFLVITPKKLDAVAGRNAPGFPPRKEVMAPEVARVAAVPKPPGPLIVFDPFRPPAKVAAEMPESEPKKEVARLIKLARDSFVAGDYGRAAEHFDRAITADPADAKAYFLYAQAKFAAGQYAEAVARIREGLARDPKWAAAAFDPTELYGDRPERFVLHLFALKKTLGENPDQATLEFLLGYQLWFAGDKPEADKLFRAAEKRLAAPGPIELFK